MQSFFSAPLLRSLQRFAASNEAEDVATYSPLTHGCTLGTQKSGNGVSVAIWGLLSPSEDDNGHPFEQKLPGGISRVGKFVVVRGETSVDEKQLGMLLNSQEI
ncbi:hypothetical protein P3T76_009849 [Phytophthora citrophthora]|uniref:Uncharacterized protein n=1 Tax=Phytophthora citrophthora TaxID=4793 RepID=A0AAD9LI05_9STRA|nr:hypothetical protein P3T76_009849 [Phytophthora citrophthora]